MIMALLLRAGEVEEVGTLPAGEGELRLLFVFFSEFRELVELVELEPGGEETSASGGSHYRTTQSQSCGGVLEFRKSPISVLITIALITQRLHLDPWDFLFRNSYQKLTKLSQKNPQKIKKIFFTQERSQLRI